MSIDALSVSCAQLTRDLLAIAKFLFHTKWDGNIPTGTPLTGASNARGMKKSRFSTNIEHYLGTDAKQSHCGMEGESETAPKLSNVTCLNDLE